MFSRKTYRPFRWAERLIRIATIPQVIHDDRFFVKVRPEFSIQLTRKGSTYQICELRILLHEKIMGGTRPHLECKPILFTDLGYTAKVESGFIVIDRNDLKIERVDLEHSPL